MPRTETYDIEAERDRVDAELDDLADEVASSDENETLSSQKQRRIQELERHLNGLEWALQPEADPDRGEDDVIKEVTVSELRAGAYIKANVRAEKDGNNSNMVVGTDTERLYRVASAIEDADFLPHAATFDQTLIAVGQLNPQFFFWLEEQVDDLTTPDIEGNSFAQRVAAKADGEPSSSTPE